MPTHAGTYTATLNVADNRGGVPRHRDDHGGESLAGRERGAEFRQHGAAVT
jgi:hypothetical protein